MFKLRSILPIILLYTQTTAGQTSALKPLSVGDYVPNVYLGKILNYQLSDANLSDFKGKLVILDFWFTGCSGCIKQFPRMKMIQDKYQDGVVIMPIGFDIIQEGSVEAFVNRRKGTKDEMKLPTAIRGKKDTALLQLFPGSGGFPREIWINPDGRLAAVTNADAITRENIDAVLRGDVLPFKQLKKPTKLDACSPFLLRRDSVRPEYGSVLSGYIDSISWWENFGKQCSKDPAVTRLAMANVSLYHLYSLAYRYRFLQSGKKGIIAERNIRSRFKDYEDLHGADNWAVDSFNRNDRFCYELALPAAIYSVDQAYDYMIKDIDKFFGIKSSIQRRKVECIAIVSTSPVITARRPTEMTFGDVSYSDDFHSASLRRADISQLVTYLGELKPLADAILQDESNSTEPLTMKIELPDQYTFEDIRRNLLKYHLDLQKVERFQDFLVLTPAQ